MRENGVFDSVWVIQHIYGSVWWVGTEFGISSINFEKYNLLGTARRLLQDILRDHEST